MFNLLEIFFIIIIHWILDFILQSDEDAKLKSTKAKNLLNHTAFYSVMWFTPLLIYGCIVDHTLNSFNQKLLHQTFDFIVFTFLFHTVTDYFTSRINARLWENGKRHTFFVSVGFDQVLHYAQLFITFYIIFK